MSPMDSLFVVLVMMVGIFVVVAPLEIFTRIGVKISGAIRKAPVAQTFASARTADTTSLLDVTGRKKIPIRAKSGKSVMARVVEVNGHGIALRRSGHPNGPVFYYRVNRTPAAPISR